MQVLTIGDILNATGGKLLSGEKDTVIRDITTDSRKPAPGALFVPIIGEKFDGHEFIQAAFDQGVEASLTQKDTDLLVGKTIILQAKVQRAHRRRHGQRR